MKRNRRTLAVRNQKLYRKEVRRTNNIILKVIDMFINPSLLLIFHSAGKFLQYNNFKLSGVINFIKLKAHKVCCRWSYGSRCFLTKTSMLGCSTTLRFYLIIECLSKTIFNFICLLSKPPCSEYLYQVLRVYDKWWMLLIYEGREISVSKINYIIMTLLAIY